MTNLNPDIATYSGVVGSEDIAEKKIKIYLMSCTQHTPSFRLLYEDIKFKIMYTKI
jgi:hypothetical protein